MSRPWTFAVYAERGKRGWKLRAYSLWYNRAWSGFVGEYQVVGETRAEAIKAAKALALADLEAKP